MVIPIMLVVLATLIVGLNLTMLYVYMKGVPVSSVLGMSHSVSSALIFLTMFYVVDLSPWMIWSIHSVLFGMVVLSILVSTTYRLFNINVEKTV